MMVALTREQIKLRATMTEAEWFWSKVDMRGECWRWRGSCKEGYGQHRWKGTMRTAHRIAYELTHGKVPLALCVCHRCDVRPCVRPDHLFLGTPADNNADMREKGRARNGSDPVSNEVRSAIRRARVDGATQAEIGKRFGISRQRIGRILRGESRAQ